MEAANEEDTTPNFLRETTEATERLDAIAACIRGQRSSSSSLFADDAMTGDPSEDGRFRLLDETHRLIGDVHLMVEMRRAIELVDQQNMSLRMQIEALRIEKEEAVTEAELYRERLESANERCETQEAELASMKFELDQVKSREASIESTPTVAAAKQLELELGFGGSPTTSPMVCGRRPQIRRATMAHFPSMPFVIATSPAAEKTFNVDKAAAAAKFDPPMRSASAAVGKLGEHQPRAMLAPRNENREQLPSEPIVQSSKTNIATNDTNSPSADEIETWRVRSRCLDDYYDTIVRVMRLREKFFAAEKASKKKLSYRIKWAHLITAIKKLAEYPAMVEQLKTCLQLDRRQMLQLERKLAEYRNQHTLYHSAVQVNNETMVQKPIGID